MSRRWIIGFGLALFAALAAGMGRWVVVRMGRQPDGSFLVSSGQRVEGTSIPFDGRPIDLALHPSGEYFAVLNKTSVFLASRSGLIPGARMPFEGNAGFRGIVWTHDGRRLFASTDRGNLREFRLRDGLHLKPFPPIELLARERGSLNPVPGGMAISRDDTKLFVAAANLNAIVEIDLTSMKPVRQYPVQNLPFEPRLSEDESTLIVSNWGGRIAREGERTAKSQEHNILVDERGAPSSGTVSLVDIKSGTTRHVEVGIHPTAIAISGERAYVANAMSDSVSEIDIPAGIVTRTFELRWGSVRVLGGMPNALAVHEKKLYVADGGDNAIAEIDLVEGRVLGYRHAGYFPTAISLSADGNLAYVLNTKGNGSVSKTILGLPGNAHDFQGTVTVVDLKKELIHETNIVARNNHWLSNPGKPALKVYNGAVKHVLYIIKENRTYDEVFGDLPEGEGDPALCSLGETVMPNHRKIARDFTLFDNGYVSGTNSADGHAWSTQCLANDYLEHFYVGYSRTYAYDGDCAMSVSNGGAIWDAAAKKGKTIRVWGEQCDDKLARIEPSPKDWFEVWEDRKRGTNQFKFTADTRLNGLKPYINHEVQCWPLYMSDQHRADVFLREFEQFSVENTIPDLMIISLPCDHGEGVNPKFPTPRAMMADNDLALGRIVEGVSKSPQWKDTCIFVVEDDAQSGPDHVDGHRTVFMAISPYNKRGYVDSQMYTQPNMLRSIEMMLGLDPMCKFDSVADPMIDCFHDEINLTPYLAVPNNVPLDERNPTGDKMSATDRFWLQKTLELDWSHMDAPDPYWLNRINWYSLYRGTRPYPDREGERPGQATDDDD